MLVEKVPWAESASRYTFPMEGRLAYHAQKTEQTTVATLMRIAWRTVGQTLTRFVRRDRKRVPGVEGRASSAAEGWER